MLSACFNYFERGLYGILCYWNGSEVHLITVMSNAVMSLDSCEYVCFDNWQRWSYRDIPAQNCDVREDFGIFGIYLLACFPLECMCKDFDPDELPEEIIYIGMSSHVDLRLARSHKAVRKYRVDTGDSSCENLWYVRGYSVWSNSDKNRNDMAKAYMSYYERALILKYARAYKVLPKYNQI